MLNTKQVRQIAKNANVRVIKTYTEKTSIKDDKRRSVCFMFRKGKDADTMYKTLKSAKIPNPIKRTDSNRHYVIGGGGFQYVRVISHME